VDCLDATTCWDLSAPRRTGQRRRLPRPSDRRAIRAPNPFRHELARVVTGRRSANALQLKETDVNAKNKIDNAELEGHRGEQDETSGTVGAGRTAYELEGKVDQSKSTWMG
jgi:hypothetical protein